ncbi:cellulose binding domain-containing protein [Massilia sp. TSP1-1-2]|uniref:cellulose binding domain-containing protein n=1 Tax=Massilia sp. TSP1-1-2 TaxID=2804649 RepID=UPI003CF70084
MTISPLRKLLALACALLPALAGAEPYRWNTVSMGGGGFVAAVVPSKTMRGLAYARTDVGGAYRWDAGSARWVSLMDWVSEDETGLLGVEAIALDRRDSAKLYLLAGTSYFNNGRSMILRSNDFGKNFTRIDVSAQFKAHGNGMGRQNGERLQVDPGSSNVLYVGTRANGLFRSTDSGSSWQRLDSLDVTSTPNGNGICLVLLDPASVVNGVAQRIVVGVSRAGAAGPSLYLSRNAGASFSPVAGAPSSLMPQRAALGSDGNLFITYANGAGPHPHWSLPEPMNQGQIWKYALASGAWSNVTPPAIGAPFGGISVAPDNPLRLVASTTNAWLQQDSAYGDHIFTSANGGATWTDVVQRGFAKDVHGVSWAAGQSIHWTGSVEFDPFDTRAVWATSGNGVFRSADVGLTPATWDFTVAGLEETVALNAVSIAQGPMLSAIMDYDGFRHADVARYSPMHAPAVGSTSGLDVAARNSAVVVRSGAAMYYSTDTAMTWKRAATTRGRGGQVALAADASVLLHAPENAARVYRSLDFGASWSTVAGVDVFNARPVADAVNPRKFYLYSGAGMLVSVDGGASFGARAALPAGASNVVRVAPGREGDVWVALNGAGLARSTDSGASFSTLAGVGSAAAVGFGKAAPGTLYPAVYIWGSVNGVRGAYRSTDQGASWTRINDDAHEYGGPANGRFIIGDMTTYGTVYLSTAGRGIAYGTIAPAPVPVPVLPAQCSYIVTGQWGGGFTAAVRITNRGSAAIDGWHVNWSYADGSQVSGSWNAIVSGANPYRAGNQSYNRVIYPGQSVEFGLQGRMPGARASAPLVTGEMCGPSGPSSVSAPL